MVSKCCNAVVYTACSLPFVQITDNWYECSQCSMPCDTMFINEPRKGDDNERL